MTEPQIVECRGRDSQDLLRTLEFACRSRRSRTLILGGLQSVRSPLLEVLVGVSRCADAHQGKVEIVDPSGTLADFRKLLGRTAN